MDQKKTGSFFKELRKEKGLTQEQLAEQLNVSGRTISRWETGSNMPDLDLLIEIADFYEVEIGELIDGERKGGMIMDKEIKETVLKVADYGSDEKIKLMKKLHVFAWVGVISFLIFLALDCTGMAEGRVPGAFADFCEGLALGALITAVIYTSRHINKVRVLKKKLLHRQ